EHYDVVLISPMLIALVYGWRRWAQRYGEWMGRAATGRSFARVTLWFASVLLLLGVVIWALQTDMYIKQNLYGTVWEAKFAHLPVPPDAHRRMHFYEVVNWAP